MAERVARAIDAGALPVPDAEDAVVFRLRKQVGELRAEYRGGAQVFVDAGQEGDLVLIEDLARRGKREVVPTERRAAIARDQRRGVETGAAIGAMLVDRKAHQGLHAGERDRSIFEHVLVVESHYSRPQKAVPSNQPAGAGHPTETPQVAPVAFRTVTAAQCRLSPQSTNALTPSSKMPGRLSICEA